MKPSQLASPESPRFPRNRLLIEIRRIFAGGAALAAGLGSQQAAALDNQAGREVTFAGIPLGHRPAVADLDADGDLDAIMGHKDGTLAYYEQLRGDLFRPLGGAVNPVAGLTFTGLAQPALGDLDGDGDFDLVVGQADGNVTFFANIGGASDPDFSSEPGTLTGVTDVGGNAAPHLADLDADGDLDLVVGHSGGTLMYFENAGNATAASFTDAEAGPFGKVSVGTDSTPYLGDLDGDGDLDLAVGDASSSQISHFSNEGTAKAASFPAESAEGGPFASFSAGLLAAPALGDLDEDDDLDLIVGHKQLRPGLFENTGTRSAATYADAVTPSLYPFAEILTAPSMAPTFVDFDDDDDLDVVIGSGDGNLECYTNTGDASDPEFANDECGGEAGPFQSVNVNAEGNFSAPAFGDVDGDADSDLIVGNDYGTTHFFRNTGTPAAPVYTDEAASKDNPFAGIDVGYGSTPVLADLDDDGDLDLLIGERSAGGLHYYVNDGTSKAPVYVIADGETGPVSPFAGINLQAGSAPSLYDIDNDGDLDLVAGESYGDSLHVFVNTGTAAAPAFGAELVDDDNPFSGIQGLDAPRPVFADLDGDGEGELVAGTGTTFGELIAFHNITTPEQRESGGGDEEGFLGIGTVDRSLLAVLAMPLLGLWRRLRRRGSR